jgi:hypothetical protein
MASVVISWRAALRGMAVALLMAYPAQAIAPADEYQVKAVFLFNFGQFVEWPAASWESPTEPFVIGIVGDDPFGSTIDHVVRGEMLGARPLVIKRFADASQITDCNILFVGRNDAGELSGALAAVRGRHVLTVTDIDGAERAGAIIVLFNENNRIRMRINLAAARAQQLVISSKLLRPAQVIGTEGT